MEKKCTARLSLILPNEDEPESHYCEKYEGHGDYHGTLGGYMWFTSNSDRN